MSTMRSTTGFHAEVELEFSSAPIVVEQGLTNTRDAAGQESPRKRVVVEQRLPSSHTVFNLRFLRLGRGSCTYLWRPSMRSRINGRRSSMNYFRHTYLAFWPSTSRLPKRGDALSPCCSSPASSTDSKHGGNASIENLALECVHTIV